MLPRGFVIKFWAKTTMSTAGLFQITNDPNNDARIVGNVRDGQEVNIILKDSNPSYYIYNEFHTIFTINKDLADGNWHAWELRIVDDIVKVQDKADGILNQIR